MKAVKNILRVTASNIISILSGVAVGFVVPKIFTVDDYGFYKTFTLYASYLGLFSLGIIDGIVLKYGACNYNELPRELFRSVFRWYFIVNSIFALIISLISIFLKFDYRIIAILLSFDLIALNVTGYFQQISQITQRFKEYSIRKILQSISNFVIVLLLVLLNYLGCAVGYLFYGILIVFEGFSFAIWYTFSYRDIVFGCSIPIAKTNKDVLDLIKKGFPLLFANLCSTLILTLDRQFVNILFSNSEYAVYAFAYSMLSLVTVATSAISTVLYPYLKRMNIESFKKSYNTLLIIMSVLVFGIITVYFPLNVFISWFLPKYSDSLVYFRIILPGIAVSSPITVIMHNYYKTMQINILYFKRSVITLLFSGIANYLAFYIFGSKQAISIASIITIVLWYLFINEGLKDKCKSNVLINILYITLLMTLFYISSGINNIILGMLLYVFGFITISFVFYKKHYVSIKKIIKA